MGSALLSPRLTTSTLQPRGSTRGLSGGLWEHGDERFGVISEENSVELLPNILDKLRESMGLLKLHGLAGTAPG